MTAINITDLNNAQLDVNTIAGVATSTAPTVTDRLGNTKNTLAGFNAALLASSASLQASVTASNASILASAAAVQGSIGYLPPVAYAAGINLTVAVQTVSYTGQTYAPLLSALPFTTSGTFETAKFRLIQGVAGADLSASGGAGLVGSIAQGAGSVIRTVASKLGDILSVRDKGAVVNSVADDTNAILAARTAVQAQGGTVVYGGKANATGFWENLSALAMEWVRGSAAAYAIDLQSSKPVISLKLFNGTPTAGPGYAAYGARFDGYTKSGVDAASSVAGLFSMQSYSSNSTGTNFNNTNQVALVANSSAMDAASSASIEAFNAISYSAYTGALPQQVIGVESDIGASRAPGWLGDANKNFGVAYSAIVAGGTQDITVAYSCDTSVSTQAFWHGAVLAGVNKTGLTVARNGAIVADTGVWVSAASAFGIYIGAKNRFSLNPGSIANFTYRPIVGLCLGQEGATSANAHKLRFTSTNSLSAEVNADIYTDSDGNLSFDVAGVNKLKISSFNGSVFVSGVQVLSTRDTGYGVNTGVTSKAGFDSATVTLQTLAQTVSALQQSLKNHGLIGA